MDKWLILIDVNKTLLPDGNGFGEEYNASKKTKEVIKRLSNDGHLVVLNTGKSFSDVKRLYELLELNTPISTLSGTNIHIPGKDNISITMNKERFDLLLNYLGDKLITMLIEGVDDSYIISNRNTSWSNDIISKKTSKEEFDFNPCIAYLELSELTDEQYNELVETFPEFYFRRWPKGENYFLEVDVKDINKSNALKILPDMYGIKYKHTMAIGDNVNDLEAIQTAFIGVAINSAEDKVKEFAQYITREDNNNSGAALFLEEYFYNK